MVSRDPCRCGSTRCLLQAHAVGERGNGEATYSGLGPQHFFLPLQALIPKIALHNLHEELHSFPRPPVFLVCPFC